VPATIKFDVSNIDRVFLISSQGSVSTSASAASHHTVQAVHAPIGDLQQVTYYENFDPGWKSGGGSALVHYRVNGFVNGYVRSDDPNASLAFYFAPDTSIVEGRAITIL